MGDFNNSFWLIARVIYVRYVVSNCNRYSVSSEELARQFARLEREVRGHEQYRGIPRVVASRQGEMSYLAPSEVRLECRL